MHVEYQRLTAGAVLGVNLVAKSRHGGEVITIAQHGTPVAAIIPYELLEYFRRPEDEADIAQAEKIMTTDPTAIPHDEVVKMFGIDPESDA